MISGEEMCLLIDFKFEKCVKTFLLSIQEKFCIVSHLQNRKKCFWCDSRLEQRGKPRFSHTIDNIIYRLDPR